MSKIYRDGSNKRESTKMILAKNLNVIGIALAVAFVFSRFISMNHDGDTSFLTFWTFAILGTIGLASYIYLSLIRLRPLAEISGDQLTIYCGIFSKKKVELAEVEKISFQYASDKDQRMKVKYPRKIAEEFLIKQANCSTKELSQFITSKFDVKITYS